MFKKKRSWEEVHRWDSLARYNSERARGVLHTPEWMERMAGEQALFNAEQVAEAKANGWIIVGLESETAPE